MNNRLRQGFTLIELLVVIAIIAILAAILFPVFAQARAKARQTACLSNMKQLGTATAMYTQDFDETFYPHRWNSGPNSNPLLAETGGAASPISGAARDRTFWISMLNPYVKNYDVFKCPFNLSPWTKFNADGFNCFNAPTGAANGCGGVGYGGQNSYGHNDFWMSPAGNVSATFGGAVSTVPLAAVQRVSSTVLVTDSTYYGVGPDVYNESGKFDFSKTVDGTGAQEQQLADCGGDASHTASNCGKDFYHHYWKNIGNANYSWSAGAISNADAITKGKSRHNEQINVQFVDGHAKAIPYDQLIGNVCLWTTDSEGPHPRCN